MSCGQKQVLWGHSGPSNLKKEMCGQSEDIMPPLASSATSLGTRKPECLCLWMSTQMSLEMRDRKYISLLSVCLSMCLLFPLQNKKDRRLLCWVIVTWLMRWLPRVTAAAPLIACLHWMMGYLIPTHSTQLLFTLAEAWGGSRGSLWPYGEGGRARAEWLEAYRLTHAPDWLLYSTEAADRTWSSRTNETRSTHTADHTHTCNWDVVRCEM